LAWTALLFFVLILGGYGLTVVLDVLTRQKSDRPWWASDGGITLVVGLILFAQTAFTCVVASRLGARENRWALRGLALMMALLLGAVPVTTLGYRQHRSAQTRRMQLEREATERAGEARRLIEEGIEEAQRDARRALEEAQRDREQTLRDEQAQSDAI